MAPTYQQIMDTKDWINKQLSNIEPKSDLLFVIPEMSSHYFKSAETTEFDISTHQSPGFYKSITRSNASE